MAPAPSPAGGFRMSRGRGVVAVIESVHGWAHDLLDSNEAAEQAGVDQTTIRVWAHRYPERLPVAGRHPETDRPLYKRLHVAQTELSTRKRAGREPAAV